MGKINLELPSELVAELGGNDEERLKVMRLELALALYSSSKLPPARAAVIAGLDRWNFSQEAKKTRSLHTLHPDDDQGRR